MKVNDDEMFKIPYLCQRINTKHTQTYLFRSSNIAIKHHVKQF